MVAMNNKEFESEAFAIQIMSRGSFVDTACGENNYIVEATTIRLNHIAHNEWIFSSVLNSRACYPNGKAGDAEYEAYTQECAERRARWEETIRHDLALPSEEGVTIAQVQSEVFTVVRIWKVEK